MNTVLISVIVETSTLGIYSLNSVKTMFFSRSQPIFIIVHNYHHKGHSSVVGLSQLIFYVYFLAEALEIQKTQLSWL